MNLIIEQLKLHNKLFKNATQDFSEADAERIHGQANHAKWLTGHLVSTRYFMGSLIGLQEKEPFPDLFGRGRGMQAGIKYPSMAELTRDWDSLSEKIIDRLNGMGDEEWNAPSKFKFPIADETLKGVVAFMAHHEAYTLGQMAYIRRLSGMEAMKYN